MTTPQPAALPELPEPEYLHEDGHDEYGYATYGRAYTADQMRAYALAALQSQPAAAGVSDAEAKYVEQIMEQAQVFASAWSLVGGRFDFGNALDDANEAKDELRALVARAILALRPQAAPMTDEQIVQGQGEQGAQSILSFMKGVRHAEAFHRIGITAQGAPEVARGAHIKATMFHDAGAYAECGACGRYSDDPKTLSDRQPVCDCGKQHYWSGSFKPPGFDAKWSDHNKRTAQGAQGGEG